jgi:hypothetical protein
LPQHPSDTLEHVFLIILRRGKGENKRAGEVERKRRRAGEKREVEK